MIFFDGKISPDITESSIEELFLSAKKISKNFAQTELELILDTLDRFSHEWRVGGENYAKALDGLKKDVPFSEEMLKMTLGILPDLLSKENLRKRLLGELGNPKMLDQFVLATSGVGKVRAMPVGEVLHVTAGNVFISCVDSLLMGFLTKNFSYLKLSSKNQFFPFFFAQALCVFDKNKVLSDKFAFLIWKGGDKKIEKRFKEKAKLIIAWGGEDMLASYATDLPLGTKLVDYGPKISLQVLTQKGLAFKGMRYLANGIARDLIMWDQQACSSPQNLFVEEGVAMLPLMEEIAKSLKEVTIKRGELSSDEYVELLKEKERLRVSKYLDGGDGIVGDEFLLHYEVKPYLRVSPLNRSLILKKYKNLEHLVEQLAPFRFYLQTCGYGVGAFEKEEFLSSLGQIGMKRFTPIGSMSVGHSGLPHDGRYGLRDFVHFITDESVLDEERLIFHLKQNVPYYKDSNATKISELPLMDGQVLSDYPPTESEMLLSQKRGSGRYFASGGSTGKPKYAFYSNEDYEQLATAFVENYRAQGFNQREKVANLFASGSMYASFLCVDRYCEQAGFDQLPIGGLLEVEQIVSLLKEHKPTLVIGLPSLLISYAQYCEKEKVELHIPSVCCAGEHLPSSAQEYLTKVWGTKTFGSAGYASVDAGLMGYQCSFSEAGVHHVYESNVLLELINQEIVVTSFMREAMPVVRYRTGDRAKWIEGECKCGRTDRRFKLLGRVDSQLNLWACRLHLSDFEKALDAILGEVPNYQLEIKLDGHNEHLNLFIENHQLKFEKSAELIEKFYEVAADLHKTRTLEFVQKWMSVHTVTSDLLIKNPRTGKTPKVIDLRH